MTPKGAPEGITLTLRRPGAQHGASGVRLNHVAGAGSAVMVFQDRFGETTTGSLIGLEVGGQMVGRSVFTGIQGGRCRAAGKPRAKLEGWLGDAGVWCDPYPYCVSRSGGGVARLLRNIAAARDGY
eukprot:gene13863-biopygen8683